MRHDTEPANPACALCDEAEDAPDAQHRVDATTASLKSDGLFSCPKCSRDVSQVCRLGDGNRVVRCGAGHRFKIVALP